VLLLVWLFSKALAQIDWSTHPIICAIALQDWFENLLIQKDFLHHQDIVVLVWNGILPEPRKVPQGLVIRPMRTEDIPAVAQLDQTAFENIWRHSLESLSLAFQQSGYSTVSEWNGKIVGYQISTTSTLHAHLARLAVHPDLQNHSIGFALVHDFLTYSRQNNIWQVTVNTQSDNNASLALYQKLGYERNGERYPVFIYPLEAG
jgi:ribosomal-protein-alanine N-acetyltransferase